MKPEQNRDQRYVLLLSPDERAELRRLAREAHLSMADLIRTRVFGRSRREESP